MSQQKADLPIKRTNSQNYKKKEIGKKKKELLLESIYNKDYLLNSLYSYKYPQKNLFFCFLTGSLIDEVTSIVILRDSISITRKFVEMISSTISTKLIQKFNELKMFFLIFIYKEKNKIIL